MVGREKYSEPWSPDQHIVLRLSWSSTGLPEEAMKPSKHGRDVGI